eukprot:tig00000523_g1850.t1
MPNLPPISPTATMRDIFDYCNKLGIPSLAQGMIELPPPLPLRKLAAEVALSEKVHTYRNRFGSPEYREAIRKLLSRHYHCNVPVEAILATQGVSGGILSSLLHFKSQGKKRAALVEPFYTYHIKQIDLAFREYPAIIKSKEDFSPDWDQICGSLSGAPGYEKCDVIIMCNPGNPHGRAWRREEVLRMVEETKKADAGLILDECYVDMVWEGQKHFTPMQWNGPFWLNLTYAVSHPATIEAMMAFHDPIYISTPFTQHALAKYFDEHYEDYAGHSKSCGDLIQRNWRVLSVALERAFGWRPVQPEGSMYGMLHHNSKTDMDAVSLALADGEGVGVAPGRMFYGHSPDNTGYVRIHCGIAADVADAIVARLDKIAAKRGATNGVAH